MNNTHHAFIIPKIIARSYYINARGSFSRKLKFSLNENTLFVHIYGIIIIINFQHYIFIRNNHHYTRSSSVSFENIRWDFFFLCGTTLICRCWKNIPRQKEVQYCIPWDFHSCFVPLIEWMNNNIVPLVIHLMRHLLNDKYQVPQTKMRTNFTQLHQIPRRKTKIKRKSSNANMKRGTL